jgi:AraC-like DNA-binding protein
MSFSLSDTFFIIVIFQLLFTAIFLFTHKTGKRISNALLGSFFLAICLNLTDNLMVMKRVYFFLPSLALWSVWLLLLFGPLLYLYTQSVLYKDYALTRRKWVHFLPFIVLFLLTETFWQLQPLADKRAILDHIVARKVPSYQYWGSGLIFLQFFVYMAACLRLIKKFKKVAGDEFSDYQRTNITWLSATILFFTFTMVLAALNSFIGMTLYSKYWYLIFTFVILLVFIYINTVLLKALQKPELFAVLKEPASEAAPTQPKYAGSPLVKEESKKMLDLVLRYMQTNKPWLEPELTLEQLARQLAVRPKILSQVINENLGQNFFDFINRYRIEEAKTLLTNPIDKKITVLEVLYQVGFNSKSSFNTLFKKHTGLTPSEFKKENRNQVHYEDLRGTNKTL